MFGLDAEIGFDGSIFKGEEVELEPSGDRSTLESEQPMLEVLSSLLIGMAWAKKSKGSDSLAEIRTWLASRHNSDTYLRNSKNSPNIFFKEP